MKRFEDMVLADFVPSRPDNILSYQHFDGQWMEGYLSGISGEDWTCRPGYWAPRCRANWMEGWAAGHFIYTHLNGRHPVNVVLTV